MFAAILNLHASVLVRPPDDDLRARFLPCAQRRCHGDGVAGRMGPGLITLPRPSDSPSTYEGTTRLHHQDEERALFRSSGAQDLDELCPVLVDLLVIERQTLDHPSGWGACPSWCNQVTFSHGLIVKLLGLNCRLSIIT